MRKNRLFALLCLVCTLSMLTGCWSDPPMDSMELPGQGTQEEPEEEIALPTSFALPYASDQTLDPVTCPDGIHQTVGSLLYEGLFRLDLQLEPQPWLCRSYSYDPATFTYTFTLRSGVTFSDGSALTAADVAATLQRARTSQRYGARLAQVVGEMPVGGRPWPRASPLRASVAVWCSGGS